MVAVSTPLPPDAPDADTPPDALGGALRDVAQYIDAGGWNQPPALFALVPTRVLAASRPDLVDPDDDSELSPIAQDPLDAVTDGDQLEEFLATLSWPPAVAGCALVQEIVVVPPEAEAEIDSVFEPLLGDPAAADAAAAQAARAHPGSRVARLISGALRGGHTLSLLQLRPDDDASDEPSGPIELLTHPDLATTLLAALAASFDHDEV